MGFLSSRKLIDLDHHASAPITETLEKICEFPCHPSHNDTFCPSPCFTICPNICNDDLSSLDPPPSSDSHSSFHPSHLFVASFSLLAFTVIALFCYGFYYRRFRRSRRPRVAETRDEFLDEDQRPAMIDHPIWYINTVGLPAAVIESIAVFKYRKGDGLVDGSDCSVCLSEFQEDETLRLLPKCSHAFHISCIDKWLRSHINCPMCRAPVAAAMPGESSGSPETRLDIPRQNEQEQHVRPPPGSGNGGGERRVASLVPGSGSPEEASSDPKRVGRSQSLLRFVGSSLQSGPVFLKRSVSCYAGDLSSPSPEEEPSGSSTGL